MSQLPDNVIGGGIDPGTSDAAAFEFVGCEIEQGGEDCTGGIGMLWLRVDMIQGEEQGEQKSYAGQVFHFNSG